MIEGSGGQVRKLPRWGIVAALTALCVGTAASHAGTAGNRPPPAKARGVFIGFRGTFADPRWRGWITLTVSNNGRRMLGVDAIAPGPCIDKDFGELIPGRDGGTGPVFDISTAAKIGANGAFRASKRTAGVDVTIVGRFSGKTVRGTVRAHVTSSFDSCTADVGFTARRDIN